jgi:putative peptidoglycan lipid II flippase
MGTVLVPILAAHKAHGRDRDMGDVLSGTMAMGALVFGCIALLLGIVFPWIAPYLVHFQGLRYELYVPFARLALLTNFLFVFGTALGQYLITVEKYWVYGITPIIYTVGTILGTIFLTPLYGAYGPILGTLGGAIAYTLLRLWAVMRSGCHIGAVWWHPDLHEMGLLMLPRILSLGAFQLQLLFLDNLASALPAGGVTINAAARNFQSVLVGVVGIAVAQSVYSILSQAAARKEGQRFWTYYWHGTWLCLGLTVPGALALMFLAPVAAWLVHLTQVLRVFSVCLAIYAVSIPFESLSHLQYRAFYAFKNTLVPATIGVLGGAAAIAVAWALRAQYGVFSIALGYTVGEIVQTVGLWIALPGQVRRNLKGGEATSSSLA